MNGKLAKRIRYAAQCMGLKPNGEGAKAPHWSKQKRVPERGDYYTRKVRQLKREYKARPYYLRDRPQESHSFVLQVKHGNATRNTLF